MLDRDDDRPGDADLALAASGSTKDAPNENYAREMQELFTLGAGDGYTERDVREHARALTGWTNSWNQATGQPEDFHFDPTLHDDGVKVIYGNRGRFGWRDSLRLVLEPPRPPAPTSSRSCGPTSRPSRCSRADERAAERAVRLRAAKQIRPVVEAMLMHPLIHAGPRMVKPPIVQIAGMLRAIGRYIDTDAWAWESSLVGQMPFYPPNVAGWEATPLAEHRHLARPLQPLTRQMIDDKRALGSRDAKKAKLNADPSGADQAGDRLLGRAD